MAGILARSGTLAQERYPEVRIARTLEELLADEQIRLCVVATPNPTHFDLAKRCLLANRDVIVDKPFTATLREAEDLVALAAQQKRLITVYQSRRWDGDFRTIKKIVNTGTLGEITEYEARYDRFRPQSNPGSWKERAGPGTGILFDLGPHLIDQALLLFGVPQAVSARLFYQRGGAVNDGFDVALEYPLFRAMLRARVLAYGAAHHFLVHGRKGSFVKYGMDPQEEVLRSPNLPFGPDWGPRWGEDPEANWGTLSLADGSGARKVKTETGDYRNYYANVRDALLGKAQLDVQPEQALNTMRVLEIAQKSHRELRGIEWNDVSARSGF